MIWADRLAIALWGLLTLGWLFVCRAGHHPLPWDDAFLLSAKIAGMMALPAWLVLRAVDWVFFYEGRARREWMARKRPL